MSKITLYSSHEYGRPAGGGFDTRLLELGSEKEGKEIPNNSAVPF
jgi:hypothetical protein